MKRNNRINTKPIFQIKGSKKLLEGESKIRHVFAMYAQAVLSNAVVATMHKDKKVAKAGLKKYYDLIGLGKTVHAGWDEEWQENDWFGAIDVGAPCKLTFGKHEELWAALREPEVRVKTIIRSDWDQGSYEGRWFITRIKIKDLVIYRVKVNSEGKLEATGEKTWGNIKIQVSALTSMRKRRNKDGRSDISHLEMGVQPKEWYREEGETRPNMCFYAEMRIDDEYKEKYKDEFANVDLKMFEKLEGR